MDLSFLYHAIVLVVLIVMVFDLASRWVKT